VETAGCAAFFKRKRESADLLPFDICLLPFDFVINDFYATVKSISFTI
jgi:hypothetical protein